MFSKTYSAVVGVVLCSFLLARQNLVFGQAPGDEDGACRQGMNAPNHDFPPEWRVLVDTYDYQNLFDPVGFPSPVWVPMSLDGDSLNWMQNVAGACTWSMSVCTRQFVQNNWLFSQYISYEDAREVFFDVSYRFTGCSEPSCNKRYVTLYQYNRASLASDSDRMDPGMYQPLLGNEEASRLVQPPDVTNSGIENTLDIPRPASNGFYLGLRDEGTCGDVTRITVYYVVCLSRVEGLVTYPETGVPVRSGADIVFDARCAPNAHNTTTLQVTAFASNSSCSPVAPGGARCQCNAGYLTSTNGLSCEECSAGTYRALGDSSCRGCPANTVTDVIAAPLCNCTSGFFRAIDPLEGPETGCTEPPGVITNLQVTSISNTTTTISWDGPATTGRADFFYRVFHSDPDNIGEFILARDNLDGSAVMYQLTGLVPFTSYIIRVTTHNGVSDQDPDGANARESEVSNMTIEGAPSPLGSVQRLCTAVVWQAPSQPNGIITGYSIRFSSNQNQIVDLAASINFFVTNEEQRATGELVQVRAETSGGVGEWTVPALVCPTDVTDETRGLFSDSIGVELAIVAICTFAGTLVVMTVLFLIISFVIYKNRSENSGGKSRSGHSKEMEKW